MANESKSTKGPVTTVIVKLGKASNFFDGTQPLEENKKLVSTDVKELEKTTKVNRLLAAGALQMASKEELSEYKKERIALLNKAKKSKSESSENKEKELLEKVKKLTENGEDAKKENATLKAQLDALQKENESLKK